MAVNIKRIIAETLYELCGEKPLAKVTILDISRRSGVSRQTFYNHFKDKNDLIRWVFTSTLDRWDLVETEGYYAYLCDLYRKAEKNGLFLRQACMLSGQNSLAGEICQTAYKYHKRYIVLHAGREQLTPQIEYALQFNAYGSANCYIQWLISRMPSAPEDVARYAYESMPENIRRYFP